MFVQSLDKRNKQTNCIRLIALYFIIKWAVKNGVKEAYKDITGKQTAEDIRIEEMMKEHKIQILRGEVN